MHRGVLPNGKEVAIKQLKAGSGQGEREFQAEVEIISRVHHKHLVSLVGYCMAGSQRMLVYEFVPSNTLEFHLHGKYGFEEQNICVCELLCSNIFYCIVTGFDFFFSWLSILSCSNVDFSSECLIDLCCFNAIKAPKAFF